MGMRKFGLIGEKLGHSFSQKYFTKKFRERNIGSENSYDLFEIENISEVKALLKTPSLGGFNVTIPYKKEIIPFLDELSPRSKKIGAVNTIIPKNGGFLGDNTDCIGFEKTLSYFLAGAEIAHALVLGTGGSSKAVLYVLEKMGIHSSSVSRNVKKKGMFSYDSLTETHTNESRLIINTTPLGQFPHIETFPEIPYGGISSRHYLYDLVYNPKETEFLKKGRIRGAKTISGGKMLVEQAEASWKLWNGKTI